MPNSLDDLFEEFEGLIRDTCGRRAEGIIEFGRGLTDDDERGAFYCMVLDDCSQLHQSSELYHTQPVSAREFVESPAMLNCKGTLYPRVLDELEEMCSGKYVEAVLTGAIGTGKTTLALYCQAYQLYLLSCYRDPHGMFGMDKASEIEIIFQSATATLAKSVEYERFKRMIDNAPYFQEVFPYDRKITSELRFPKGVIVKPVSGNGLAALGQNVIGGILDELNFMSIIQDSKRAADGNTYDQAIEAYNTIARRRESRFLIHGKLPGMLCLVSSKRYPGQFTDTKQEEAKNPNRRIYVFDKRLWEVKPEGTYGDERFAVFAGDATRNPRIMEQGELIPDNDRDLVLMVPTDLRNAFETDVFAAMRDIGGMSTQSIFPFMSNVEKLTAAMGSHPGIFSRPDCDFKDTMVGVLAQNLGHRLEPRFVHIDLGLSGDSAGLAVGYIPRFIRVDRGDHFETLPEVVLEGLLEIKPPRGGQIEFARIRQMLYAMRDQLRIPIRWVTFDSWQSKDSQQILAAKGFTSGESSLDRTPLPYEISKQAILDGRVYAPFHKKAHTEWRLLQQDPEDGKVDHPPNGSKDVADAMAGVIYGLTMRRELWAQHGVSLRQAAPSIQVAAEKNAKKEPEVKRGREGSVAL